MTEEKKIKQKPTHILYNNAAMIAKVFRLAPGYIIAMVFSGIFWGTLNACETIFLFKIFNAMDASPTFENIAKIILLMALFYLTVRLYTSWHQHYYHAAQEQKLQLRMHRELFETARQMDLCAYDDPVFYNDFVFAMDESSTRAIQVINDIEKIINRLVASVTVLGALFTIDVLAAALLLVTTVVDIVIRLYVNKLEFRHQEETKPDHRRKNYINRLYYLPDYAKELRLSQVDSNLSGAYWESMNKIVETDLQYGKKYFLWNFISSMTGYLSYYGILIYMIFRLVDGSILVGALAASVNAVWQCRWLLNDLIRRFTKFPAHSLFIEKYLTFLASKPKIISGEVPVEPLQELTFRHVNFSYASQDSREKNKESEDTDDPGKPVLRRETIHDVSLTIRRGERIAFVGYNGAGKTTLTKLMMRLYDTTSGEILYNGINIKELKLDEYRAHIGAIFQDYHLFAGSIAENVIGDTLDGTPEQQAAILNALHAATFDDKLAALPDGINTQLTREFDDKGTNLSGGEAQKIAIARIFARPYELMIMDEPSSALDPLAEYELNHAILEKATDRTIIFISHRLSTTRMADRIYMFENGSIIESGSHEELMTLNGKYARMFRLQAEKYQQ